jgi:hypothetical protein
MKNKSITNILLAMLLVLLSAAFSACSDHKTGTMNMEGDCEIEAFALDNINGVIDHAKRMIVVNLPEVYETSAMKVTGLKLSAGAKCNLNIGDQMDMGTSHGVTVTNGDAFLDWVISVRHAKPHIVPKAVFLGLAATKAELDPEARTACDWMLENVEGARYASYEDIRDGICDLKECKIIWWHYHSDTAVDGHDDFLKKAENMLTIKNQLVAYYNNGGSFLLTRYATNLASFIGATGTDDWTTPNNCWGNKEMSAEQCSAPWSFFMHEGQEGHDLYKGLVMGATANEVFCTDKGYYVTNSTAQYHIGGDWGGYDNYDAWLTRTDGVILGVGGDKAIVAWEYPAKGTRGGILCIGSGCFDWYSYTFGSGYVENYHKNIAIMTTNAINHLTK